MTNHNMLWAAMMIASSITTVMAFTTRHHQSRTFVVPSRTPQQQISIQQSSFPIAARRDLSLAMTSSTTSVKHLPDSAVEVILKVPAKATKAAFDRACAECSKQVRIPGFRKGSKIPPAVLEQTLVQSGAQRNALRIQAINSLLGNLVETSLKEQGLDPIGQPQLTTPVEELAESFEPGQEFELSVQCDVWPELTWNEDKDGKKPYLGLSAKYVRQPVDEKKLNVAVQDLRERYATMEPIQDKEYALKMGDACMVNMDGYMAQDDGLTKGEPLPSNVASGENVEVILGTGRYMEGLVEGLVGAKVGETKTVAVSFPEKLRDKSLAGKRAIFDVQVMEAMHRVVPEITDEFAAKIRPTLTAESLMDELRKAVDAEDAKKYNPQRNNALGKALAATLEHIPVPDTLVTNQAREKFALMMTDMRNNGVADEEIKRQITPENFQKYKDIVKEDIVRDMRISMAVDEIARVENIQVPDNQVEEQLQAVKQEAMNEENASEEDFDEAMIRQKVETTMQRQMVMDFLAENADLQVDYVKEEEFDEALLQKLADESLAREKELKEKAAQPKEPVAAEPEEPEIAEPEPIIKAQEEAAPVAREEKSEKEKEAKSYEGMSVEEQAFQALLNTGALEMHQDPDDPNYDSSKDDEFCDENVFVKDEK